MHRRWLVPLLIVLVGLAIRLMNFPTLPGSLYWDEMAIVNDAMSVAATGRDLHNRTWFQPLFISYGDYKLPVYIWLSSVVAFFTNNPFLIARLPSLLAGLSMFGSAAVFVRFWPWQSPSFSPSPVKINSKKAIQNTVLNVAAKNTAQKTSLNTAMITATLLSLAIIPWSLHFSRVGFEGHVATALVWWSAAVAVYGWVRFAAIAPGIRVARVVTQNPLTSLNWRQLLLTIWPLIIATLLGTLAVYTYFSVRFVWPIIFVTLAAALTPKLVTTFMTKFTLDPVLTPLLTSNSTATSTSLTTFANTTRLRLTLTLALLVIWILSLVPMWQADFYQASQQFRLSTPSVLNQPDMPGRIQEQRSLAPVINLAGRNINNLISKLAFNRATDVVRPLMQNMLAHLDPSFLFLRGDHNLRHGTGYTGVMFLWMAPFWLAGIILMWRHEPRLAIVLSVWWLVGTLPAAVPLDGPHALRALNTLPVHVMFVAFGLVHFYHQINDQLHTQSQPQTLPQTQTRPRPGISLQPIAISFTALIPIGAMMSAIFTWLYINQTLYKIQAASEWQDGYLQVAQYIADQHDKYARVTVDEFDERFFLYYQPYSGLSWQEIQRSPSQDFTRSQFGNVTIKNFTDWHDLEQGVLYVVSAAQLPPGINGEQSKGQSSNGQSSDGQISNAQIKNTVYGSSGEPLFFSLVVSE